MSMNLKIYNQNKFWLVWGLLIYLIGSLSAPNIWAQEQSDAGKQISKKQTYALDKLLKKIESRYSGPGFSAEFEQQSTISAMEITDSASGKVYIKRPGKMRWEYILPEAQIIISDGTELWIYQPEENQVMVGKAPSFFADGKGAAFLSDLKNLRNEFSVTLEPVDAKGNPVIKLIPKKKSKELTEIYLTISHRSDTIDLILTKNGFGDETRIQLNKYRLNQELSEDMFVFEVPNGADVLQMDQP